MKRRIKLTPILIALILSFSASLTSCNDSKTGTDSESVTVSQTEKETNADTDAKTDSATSEAPTDNIVTETPTEDTEAPETDAPTTKAPETEAPSDGKTYASKEEYPDDWGESFGDDVYWGNSFGLRTDGKILFWENSRVLHTIPKGFNDIRNWRIDFADEENDQFVFRIRNSDGVSDYYSMVDGVIYKLNESKVISSFYDGTGPFIWVEENGLGKSVNNRTNKYNEVYIEAEGVVGYVRSINSFYTSDEKVVKPNSENILAKVKEIK